MLEKIVRWSIAKRRIVLWLTLAITSAFALLSSRLTLDALPDVTGNQVVVLTRAPGFAPEEVEQLVTRKIEVALSGVPGIETTRSLSRYGLSSVTLLFSEDVEILRARQLVVERLGSLGDMPSGVEIPELGPMTGGLGEIFHFTLSSPSRTQAEVLELVRLRVAPLLRGTPGVVEVNTWGGHSRTFDVVVDPARMVGASVTLEEVRHGLAGSIGTTSGDSLVAGPGRAALRSRLWPASPGELGELWIESGTGLRRVRDLGHAEEGALPRTGAATRDGQGETVYCMVQMLTGANALEVTGAIHDRLPEVRKALPADVKLDVIYDRSTLVRATLWTVAKNLAEGGALVILVLFLILGSFRAGLIVALVIPLSMLAALAGMVLLGVPGNLMSLGAIDFGLLVDGAVVFVEAVFHRFEARKPEDSPDELLRSGILSVVRPVFFSIAIILLVYVPILTLTGVDGKMFRPMAITVVLAIAASIVVTLVVVPAFVATWLRPSHLPKRVPKLLRAAEIFHEQQFSRALKVPKLVALSGIGLLIVGYLLFVRAGTAFIPQLDEGALVVQTTRPPDISIGVAVTEAGRVESAMRRIPEVQQVISRIGSPAVATDMMGIEQADVFVSLAPRDEWRAGLTREELIQELEASIESFAPGGEAGFTQPIQMRFNELVGGDVTDVSLSIYGDDLGRLRTLADQFALKLSDLHGAEDVRVLAPPAMPLLDVTPNPLLAARFGLTPQDVMNAVTAFRVGLEVGKSYVHNVEVPIRLRTPEPDAFALEEALIATPVGLVPLHDVATIRRGETPGLVNHEQGERRIVVGFNVRGADLGSVVRAAQQRTSDIHAGDGYRVEWGGQYESLEQATGRLRLVMPVVLLGIFLLLWLLFQKALPALIILTHVPFAAVGGMIALSVRAMPISISAAVGFIALSGIAVLNGVVLLSAIRKEEERGCAPAEAAALAVRTRVRPVTTTALVAALGFVPMMLATGVGSEVQKPLATVVVGGLVTSTLLTLILLPVLYPFFQRRILPRNGVS